MYRFLVSIGAVMCNVQRLSVRRRRRRREKKGEEGRREEEKYDEKVDERR